MRALPSLALGFLALPVLSAQMPPAASMVVMRRNQVYGSANFIWNHFQNGALIQQFPVGSNITVPAGQKFVVTGIRGWFTGQYGADVSLGFSSAGFHSSEYLKLVRTPVQGTLATLEFSETFSTGISFGAGTQVELKVTKINAASSDTMVNAYLYGYFE